MAICTCHRRPSIQHNTNENTAGKKVMRIGLGTRKSGDRSGHHRCLGFLGLLSLSLSSACHCPLRRTLNMSSRGVNPNPQFTNEDACSCARIPDPDPRPFTPPFSLFVFCILLWLAKSMDCRLSHGRGGVDQVVHMCMCGVGPGVQLKGWRGRWWWGWMGGP